VFGSRALQALVDEAAPDTDLAYAYSSSMGAFLLPHPELARVMHFAELDSDKWRQYAERTRPPLAWVYRREHRTLQRFETELAHAVDANVFCTPLEARIFLEAIPEAAEPGHLVFTGVMNYYPNVDGCEHFAREILPRIRAAVPDARFTIVGAHPTPAVRALERLPGVAVTGFVDDTRDWLRRAAVSVAPLRIARGIQNKVLEAMAMGLPVVGTTPATQGVGGESPRDYLVADGAEAQASAVIELLRDPERARELGRRARRFVEERYDWEVVLAPLDDLLASCAGGREPSYSSA